MNTKVENLALSQFTAFDQETKLEFCPGINVFIGKNSTGKSHAMKAIYSILKVCEQAQRDEIDLNREKIRDRLYEKFRGVFRPDKVGRLVRHGVSRKGGSVSLTYNSNHIEISITSLDNLSASYDKLLSPEPSVFLPAHEFLSAYQGFVAAYQNRELAFDETYYDLSVALSATPLRGPRQDEIKSLVEPLQKAIWGAKITQQGGKFYVRLPEANLEAPLVSEGYRKFAGLIYLLINGSLTQNGVLFWDEPEANLNPKMVTTLVDVLEILAKSGMQIFISTHDYLLSQELSLKAEYLGDDMRFFGFSQPKRGAGVIVESGRSLVEISENPIIEEFAAHYDREENLSFRRRDV
ncbi:MAG: AAA family ATPase [Anaerolineales bacterium]